MIKVKVTENMKRKAREYSTLSKEYTTRKHDFHEGGTTVASVKMYEGKIGEKVFQAWLDKEDIYYLEDTSSHEVADNYDFLISNYRVDVKTRTEDFHIRTVELVEQFYKRPKDIYIAAHYRRKIEVVELIDVISARKLADLNQVENLGYKDNFVAYDHQLSSMNVLKAFFF